MHRPQRRVEFLVTGVLLLSSLGCSLLAGQAPPQPAAEPTVEDSLPPASGVIRGVIWHELCDFEGGEGGEPVVLGQGCVQWGDGPGEFGPNQVRDDFEAGFSGVVLHLGAGACPASGLATTKTADDGSYRFADLAPGTYCVSYSNTADGNDALLIPGGPTSPSRDEAGFQQTIDLEAGSEAVVDFGYAWQFFD